MHISAKIITNQNEYFYLSNSKREPRFFLISVMFEGIFISIFDGASKQIFPAV